MRSVSGLAATVLGLLTVSGLQAQEGKPAHPMPSDEHAYLRQFEGEWRTTGKGTDLAGKDVDMVGVEYDRMVLGDFWLSFVYRSQIHDKPFVGHGMIGYDPMKKKYIGTWVDSMSPYMATFEGSVDPAANTLTLESNGVDPMTQKACKGRLVFQFQDADHRSLQSFRLDDSNKAQMMFDLHFTREAPRTKEPPHSK